MPYNFAYHYKKKKKNPRQNIILLLFNAIVSHSSALTQEMGLREGTEKGNTNDSMNSSCLTRETEEQKTKGVI